MFEKRGPVKTALETAEIPNKLFSIIIKNLEILVYSKYESFKDNIEDLTSRERGKERFKGRDTLCFRELRKKN